MIDGDSLILSELRYNLYISCNEKGSRKMSVILGYQTKDKIVIAGDRRVCNADGVVISEEEQKVYQVNKHLCFASAGRAFMGKIINDEVAKANADNLYIEDIDKIVSDFYQNAKDKNASSIYLLPSCLIVAGLNRKGESGIYAIIYNSGKEDKKYIPMIIYNPADMTNMNCALIMGNNIKKYGLSFVKNTIKEISEKSIWVNDKYNTWTFDKKQKKGILA